MRKGWNPAVSINVEMEVLLERAMNQNFVPVIDDRCAFIGIITRKDIILYFTARQFNSDASAESKREEDCAGA